MAGITTRAIVEPAKNIPTAILHGVASREYAKARQFANTHNIAHAYDDYEALLNSPDIDLIYNALPVSLHAKWSIKALQAGKHVLCEKPFAMNATEASQMIQTAEQYGMRIIEAFHHRYHPAFTIFLKWLADGKLGAVRNIDAHFNVGIADDGTNIRYRPELGGGAMMDLGCYPVSWAISAARSAPTKVSSEAVLSTTGVDESMRAMLSFEHGVTANVSCSMAAVESFSRSIKVTCEHGTIRFENPLLPHAGGQLTRTVNGVSETAQIDSKSTYFYQLQAVINGLEKDTELPTEGKTILIQQETLDSIYKSAGLKHLRFTDASSRA